MRWKGETHAVNVATNATVKDILLTLALCQPAMHTVMFGGGQLPPEQPLADTGVCAQAVVDVVFKRFLFTGSWDHTGDRGAGEDVGPADRCILACDGGVAYSLSGNDGDDVEARSTVCYLPAWQGDHECQPLRIVPTRIPTFTTTSPWAGLDNFIEIIL